MKKKTKNPKKMCVLKPKNNKQNHTHTHPNNLVDLWAQEITKQPKTKITREMSKK